jgi:hypothetical protein
MSKYRAEIMVGAFAMFGNALARIPDKEWLGALLFFSICCALLWRYLSKETAP